MIRLIKIVLASCIALSGLNLSAQDGSYDVFIPIAKYIGQGDVDRLSAWFADNLEISIISSSNDSSKNQAKQILKSFFESYTPRSFDITHTAGRTNMKYALGSLNAGGEVFIVTIFVTYKHNGYKIQQLEIDRQ
jgi:hypothetical protein